MRLKANALVLLLVLVSFNMALADWSGATADQYVSSFSPQNKKVYAPSFAAGPEGNLYTVWVQGLYSTDPNEIYFSRSTDDGVTWSGTSSDMMISAIDGDPVYNGGIFGARRTDIAIDSEGRIYVCWPENYVTASFDTTQEIMMVMSTDFGNTWIHSDTDYPISDTISAEGANSPNIAIDANDDVYVVWNQEEPVSETAEIYISISTDNGETWSGRTSDRFISLDNGTSSSAPDIACDIAGKIHVVWREYIVSGDYRVFYGISTDNGATFSSETSDQIISFAPYSIVFPRITTGPCFDQVHVIYAQNDTAMYVGSTDCGSSWSEADTIYGGSSYDMYGPDIGVTQDGTIIAILDEQYPGTDNRQAYAAYSYDNGLNWSTPLEIASYYDAGTYDRIYIPTLGISQDGVLHITYGTNYPSSSNSYQEMCYTRCEDFIVPTGTISGTVTDAGSQVPIQNVLVQTMCTGIGVFTDENGNYTLPDLCAGYHDISFSHDNYEDIIETDVEVIADEITTLDVEMVSLGYNYLPGDCNMALGLWPPTVIGGDVSYLVGYFIGTGNAPCKLDDFWASADVTGDCSVIGGDVSALVGFFIGTVPELSWCPDYEPLWPPVPDEAPEGWPNCDVFEINSKIIPTGSVK